MNPYCCSGQHDAVTQEYVVQCHHMASEALVIVSLGNDLSPARHRAIAPINVDLLPIKQ